MSVLSSSEKMFWSMYGVVLVVINSWLLEMTQIFKVFS